MSICVYVMQNFEFLKDDVMTWNHLAAIEYLCAASGKWAFGTPDLLSHSYYIVSFAIMSS